MGRILLHQTNDCENAMNTTLRKRAEAILSRSPDENSALPTRDVQELVHELQIYQAELEIQNEELRRAQQELVGARDRYKELYQSVPVGCLTLDSNRMIRDANAASTAMLGTGSQDLAGQRLDKFVSEEDGDPFYLLMRRAAETGNRQRRDIRFRWDEGCPFWADLEVVPTLCPKTEAFFLITLSDITARKQAEESSWQIAAELQATNKALEDSRRAALNLMEDAVETRKQIEQAELERQQTLEQLKGANDELSQFNRVAVGREIRMVALKQEVNALCVASGQSPRYNLEFENETA